MIWRVRPDFWKSKRFEESRFINQKSEPCKSKLYNMLVQDPHQNKSGAGVFVLLVCRLILLIFPVSFKHPKLVILWVNSWFFQPTSQPSSRWESGCFFCPWPPHLEDHPTWKVIWKGSHNPILRGQQRSPWLLTTYKSWDDPPSG